ncbi:MAG TPA: LamG-like jellyroll fold domain-containing protein, partial [Candidatus Acidoferrales bacterium]|nr:LamG-like jellyroll fold domain-containing protein [Candidatus Acidoferrales bacterium]
MKIRNSVRQPAPWFAVAAAAVLATAPMARADYQSTVVADSPLAFYPLNLAVDTGGTATDVSGNGNDGSYVNIFSGFNNTNGPSAYIANAVSFDGVDTSVDLSGVASLTSLAGAVTLEAWVQPADSTTFGDILGKGYDSVTSQESYIRVDGPYGAFYDVNLGNAQITGGQQATTWSHVVLVNNGTSTSLYINGVLIQSKSDTVGALSFSDAWSIGNGTSAGNGRHFNGNIAAVAFYPSGLTAAQVLNHYFVGLVGVPAANAAPIINVQPQSQPSYVGGSVTLSVTAVSGLPMTNQWYVGSTPLSGKTNATLTLSNLQLANAGNYSVVVGNANGTTNSSVAALTVSTPRNLAWSASGNNGNWDNATANWINLANSSQTAFNPGDAVLFDDTPGVPTTVAVTDTVVPSVVNITASANSYTLNGPSRLSGNGSLIKDGSSTLSIFTPGGFAGAVTIKGGTVYAGNNCFNSVSSIAISNNATLDLGGGSFNSVTPISVAGTGTSGQGALINTYADYPNEAMNITMTDDTTFGGTARFDMGNGAQINGAHNLTLDWSASGNYAQWNGVTVGANVLGVTTTNGSTLGITGMDTSCQNPGTLFSIAANAQLVLYSGG